ncbi:MAG: hypothetical protein IJX76_09945, partial [Clostridia bacterium]|nr:hypothetical protein [Clostridia bacterium]
MNRALTSIRPLETTPYKFSGEKVLEFFSNPEVITIYLAVILFLVALLASAILVSLHLVRKSTDNLPDDINDLLSDAKDIQKNKQPKHSTGTSRFPQLAKIDEELHSVQTTEYTTCPLDELCEQFRNFAAGKLGLYYDIANIRRFIAGMGISKLIILRGISGTGKTSLAYAAGEFFG